MFCICFLYVGSLNCASFVAGIIEAVLNGCNFVSTSLNFFKQWMHLGTPSVYSHSDLLAPSGKIQFIKDVLSNNLVSCSEEYNVRGLTCSR